MAVTTAACKITLVKIITPLTVRAPVFHVELAKCGVSRYPGVTARLSRHDCLRGLVYSFSQLLFSDPDLNDPWFSYSVAGSG
jgi:hypothetical protein